MILKIKHYKIIFFLLFFSFNIYSQNLDYIFKSGKEGYKCFRIPTIIKSKNGTVLAFAEGRKNVVVILVI